LFASKTVEVIPFFVAGRRGVKVKWTRERSLFSGKERSVIMHLSSMALVDHGLYE
jgi:hypothetical protein